MVAAVELAHEHDVCNLAVLVCLSTIKLLPIDHCYRCLHSSLHAFEVSDVCFGWNLPTKLLVVHGGCHGAKDHAPCWLAFLHVRQQERAQQVVAQVVRCEAQLHLIWRPAGSPTREQSRQDSCFLVGVGEVHSSVAHKAIQGSTRGTERIDEATHAVLARQVQVQHGVVVLRELIGFGGLLCLAEVPASHDDVPLASQSQFLRGCQAQT
mmetsp:Transcript_10602/g.24122  ORF Transcript_10602/g.24122 Transcript_10602/m.24122 type:complete len:209 (+) Transcript_10602:502-1128(+)